MLCQIVKDPPFQNFTLKCSFLARRRASENLSVTLKCMSKHFFKFNICKGRTRSKMVSLVCLNAKNEDIVKNCFFLCPSQKPKIKCIKFIFRECSLISKEVICNNKNCSQFFVSYIVVTNQVLLNIFDILIQDFLYQALMCCQPFHLQAC